jgi:7-carboxy-7-deazaguanine synthase
MMSKQIIRAIPAGGDPVKKKPEGKDILRISEFFCDTIQGENFVGYPAAFLRFQGCTLRCVYCDTTEVWRTGNYYTFGELFKLMDDADLPRKLYEGQHLVLTGGSPLLQEAALIRFIEAFIEYYEFKPFIEIENECVIMPTKFDYIDCWNNSPKLSSSGVRLEKRYKPDILFKLSQQRNSWFKFVVSAERQWAEIYEYFLHTALIQKEQVVLMPEGATRDELMQNRMPVLEMAVKHNVRYTTREHIVLWDKKIGV